jgi:hypothetical protein
MNSHRFSICAVVLAVGGSIAFAPAAKAATCTLDSTGNSSQGLTIGQLKATGFSCTIGDKTYSNFHGFSGFADADIVDITQTQFPDFLNHTLNINRGSGSFFGVGSYGFSFSLNVNAPSINKLSIYSGDSGSSIIPSPTGTLKLTGSMGTVSHQLASAPAFLSYSSPKPTTDNYTLLLEVLSGQVEYVSTTVKQESTRTVPTSAPGPLPLIGALSAFGFSRQLRARIRKARA